MDIYVLNLFPVSQASSESFDKKGEKKLNTPTMHHESEILK